MAAIITPQAASGTGARVLLGECAMRGELPYAAFAQIVRDVLAELQAGPQLPAAVQAELLALADVQQGRQPRPAPLSLADPAFERQRLFESFTTACQVLAQAAPLLLVIEDVHWADAGTLSLLRHLARDIGQSRMLLLLTYRDNEVALSESRGLPDMLREFGRERQAQVIRLERLTREKSGRMLAALLATPAVSHAFRDGLFDETEGNPLFLEEVCKILIENGQLYFSGGAWQREDMRAVVLPRTVARRHSRARGAPAETHTRRSARGGRSGPRL